MHRKPGYIYDPIVEKINYGVDHPMRPFKVALTHSLIKSNNQIPHLKGYVSL